jgi:putative membrane protein
MFRHPRARLIFIVAAVLPAAACRSEETPRRPETVARGLESFSVDDRDFVSEAAPAGLFEVETSELALQKSVSGKVREFAQMMVDDHGAANRKLNEIVRRKGGMLPTMLDHELQRKYDDLRELSGQEFEKSYHEAQVRAHDAAIKLFEDAAKDADDGELRKFASETLPTLQKHRKELDTW